ncbi:hypothetical protein H920_15978 [Fukomys damarensis]|uniref:Uncharacterized protein n=1 Tax=Fukomys damarensis TaxID=885580 RepID=A0A091CT99_FUKDA|nr:hypothetical protein H920_15978 [Fukomys damarensis]
MATCKIRCGKAICVMEIQRIQLTGLVLQCKLSHFRQAASERYLRAKFKYCTLTLKGHSPLLEADSEFQRNKNFSEGGGERNEEQKKKKEEEKEEERRKRKRKKKEKEKKKQQQQLLSLCVCL